GYTISRASEALTFVEPDEVTYAGGADIAVTPRLTVVGDLIGRTLRNTVVMEPQATAFGASYQQLGADFDRNLNLLLGSAGVKFNPRGKGLVSFSVLFPLNDNGLTSKLTWTGGVEVSF